MFYELRDNLYGSDPGYDEAFGPYNPHDFNSYVSIDEVSQEDHPLRFVVVAMEDAGKREQRLHWVDPDEPLGKGETKNMVREQVQQRINAGRARITVDPDYQPDLEPTPGGVRTYKLTDYPVTSGPLPTTNHIWMWSDVCERLVRTEDSGPGKVVVTVRRKKYTAPAPSL